MSDDVRWTCILRRKECRKLPISGKSKRHMRSCAFAHFVCSVKKFCKLFSSGERMDGPFTENIPLLTTFGWMKLLKQKSEMNPKARHERITVDGDLLGYVSDNGDRVGVYVGAQPLSPDHNYFEIEVLDTGVCSGITVGLVPNKYPLDKLPGCLAESVAYHVEDGKLYKGRPIGSSFISKCEIGDRIGCGIHFDKMPSQEKAPLVPVFFTKNGKEITNVMVKCGGELWPAVGMTSVGEEVRLSKSCRWQNEDESQMSVDGLEEEWCRLHDIRLNEQTLEYVGRGKSIIDVGLAQARQPLDTTSHYFEIEIVDPGENCFIAIGLTRPNYPKHRHPGWNSGSIAYHADDGKIFVGSGVGEPFGPKCHKGDVMGCGIIFPRDYEGSSSGEAAEEQRQQPSSNDLQLAAAEDEEEEEEEAAEEEDDEEASDRSSDDEHFTNNRKKDKNQKNVQVFFTRNGKFIGSKEVSIPLGGFHPTVGMLSLAEKVRVDLHPLSG